MLVAGLLAMFGCVSTQHDAYLDARSALRECEAQHPASPAACAELAEEASRRYSDYEKQAQSAWGCESSPERCVDVQRPGR